jgi:hypothetical protein
MQHFWPRTLLMIIVQQGAMIFFMRVARYQLNASAGLAALVAIAFALVFSFVQKRSDTPRGGA